MKAKAVAAGFRTDVETLFKKFFDEKTVRFEHFANAWRSLRFTYIFKLKQNANEMREFVEQLFAITLSIQFSPSASFIRQVACLYLLYGIYCKQQIEPKVTIRLTIDQFKKLRQLYETCKKDEHYDAAFIWLKMLSKGAFSFVEHNQHFGPSFMKHIRVGNVCCDESDNLVEQLCLSLNPQLDELQNIHSNYVKMKALVNDESIQSLKYIGNDIFVQFKDELKQLKQEFDINSS